MNRTIWGGLMLLWVAATWPATDRFSTPDRYSTPDQVIDALYAIISADAGESRDWDAFRDLFVASAQLVIAIDSDKASGLIASDVETLIAQTDAHYANSGFHEIELDRKTVVFGALASVYSSFEIKLRVSDANSLMRGLNHFQLLFDGDRWWVVANSGIIETSSWRLPKTLQ